MGDGTAHGPGNSTNENDNGAPRCAEPCWDERSMTGRKAGAQGWGGEPSCLPSFKALSQRRMAPTAGWMGLPAGTAITRREGSRRTGTGLRCTECDRG